MDRRGKCRVMRERMGLRHYLADCTGQLSLSEVVIFSGGENGHTHQGVADDGANIVKHKDRDYKKWEGKGQRSKGGGAPPS